MSESARAVSVAGISDPYRQLSQRLGNWHVCDSLRGLDSAFPSHLPTESHTCASSLEVVCRDRKPLQPSRLVPTWTSGRTTITESRTCTRAINLKPPAGRRQAWASVRPGPGSDGSRCGRGTRCDSDSAVRFSWKSMISRSPGTAESRTLCP